MAEKHVTAYATVEVTLRIESGSTWGSGCSIDQIHKQAVEVALGKLRKATTNTRDFTLVGTPMVVSVHSRVEDH